MIVMEEHQNRLVAQLVELTVIKIKHLENIVDLTCRQGEALEEGLIESLYSYIENKQEHIDAIKELDKKFELIYMGFEQKTLNIPAALQTHVARVQKLVEDIRQAEAENNIQANKVMEEVKLKLQDLNKGKKGYNAYKNASFNQDARFLDKTK